MNIDNKYNENDKRQKIAAALYLVTGHLSDMDPLRMRIREEAIALLETATDESGAIADRLATFLSAASYANLISEHNKNIILAELKYYVDPLGEDALLTTLLQPPAFASSLVPKKTYSPQQMSYMSSRTSTLLAKKENTLKNKDDRQTTILSFINDRKSATIKDITALFPGLSEKTIQRELGAMVHAGKITKRGDKRWSIYLSVPSERAL